MAFLVGKMEELTVRKRKREKGRKGKREKERNKQSDRDGKKWKRWYRTNKATWVDRNTKRETESEWNGKREWSVNIKTLKDVSLTEGPKARVQVKDNLWVWKL